MREINSQFVLDWEDKPRKDGWLHCQIRLMEFKGCSASEPVVRREHFEGYVGRNTVGFEDIPQMLEGDYEKLKAVMEAYWDGYNRARETAFWGDMGLKEMAFP